MSINLEIWRKVSQWNRFQRGCYSPSDDIDVFFCFEMVLTTRNLLVYPYSDYQTELHDIIQNLHDEGLGYRKIAQWLNENEYQTPRGKKFFNSHVYSIHKKKRLRDERLNQKVEVEYGDFSLEFIERKLINSI
jgi:hypothetical protein